MSVSTYSRQNAYLVNGKEDCDYELFHLDANHVWKEATEQMSRNAAPYGTTHIHKVYVRYYKNNKLEHTFVISELM
jgi:hypothetical protein